MSVLIKMEMPTNCCQCPVNMEVCKRGYKYLLAHPELYDKREDDCPLVPVPPHGRLIEESKVLDIVSEWCPDDDGSVGKYGDLREMLDEIEAIPTVIPASKEAEE